MATDFSTNVADTVNETNWQKVRHWFASWFRPALRDATPEESRLRETVADFSFRIEQDAGLIVSLKSQVAELQSEKKLLEAELKHFALIHERNQMRTRAETMEFAERLGAMQRSVRPRE